MVESTILHQAVPTKLLSEDELDDTFLNSQVGCCGNDTYQFYKSR